jgi:ABC-type sugar transport system substrate-binding protein
MPTIVLSLLTRDNDFQLYQADDARQAAAREGLELEVLYADNNAILQIQQLYKYVHGRGVERPAALVVEPVSDDGMDKVAARAVESGIGWIGINRGSAYLRPLSARHPDARVSSVLIDQVEVGRIQARQFRALLPRGGQVLFVLGPSHSGVVAERREGLEQAIAGSGITLTPIDGAWTEESGEKAVASWLRLRSASATRVDLIGCQNDAMAVGARRAARAHPDRERREEWSRLPCTGVDGLPEGGQRLVDRGELAATVIGPSNGAPAVQLAARFLRGVRPIPPQVVQKPASYPPEEQLRPRAGAGG